MNDDTYATLVFPKEESDLTICKPGAGIGGRRFAWLCCVVQEVGSWKRLLTVLVRFCPNAVAMFRGRASDRPGGSMIYQVY